MAGKHKGKGTFKALVKNASDIIEALENGVVELPARTEKEAVTMGLEGSGAETKLVLDFTDAPVFGLANVRIRSPYPINARSVSALNGTLVVRLDITVT